MAEQTCLFKDANHVCGEPAVSTIAVGPEADHTVDVPACARHVALLQSSAEAAQLLTQAAQPDTAEVGIPTEAPAVTTPAA